MHTRKDYYLSIHFTQCGASSRQANQHPTQFVVCVVYFCLPKTRSIPSAAHTVSIFIRAGRRTCHRTHINSFSKICLSSKNTAVVLQPASCDYSDGWKGVATFLVRSIPELVSSIRWTWKENVQGPTLTRRRVFSCVWW